MASSPTGEEGGGGGGGGDVRNYLIVFISKGWDTFSWGGGDGKVSSIKISCLGTLPLGLSPLLLHIKTWIVGSLHLTTSFLPH